MANYDNPNGFRPVSFPARTNVYEVTAATTVTKGDALAIASGKVLPYVAASHTAIIGVAAESGSGGDEIQVYDDFATEFEGQCSGTFAATLIGTAVDLEGTTGIMEVDENGATNDVAVILGHYPLPGADEIGANSRVKVVFGGHATLA
jgi:predicted lipoprotein